MGIFPVSGHAIWIDKRLGNIPVCHESSICQLSGQICYCVLDDIIIYSASWTEHLVHLQTVLQTLRTQQFFAKRSKCSFGQTSINYLGHIISDRGVSTDPEKTQVMKKWPVPANTTELRGFLGLVKGYGLITKPLTQLLTKQGFHWN